MVKMQRSPMAWLLVGGMLLSASGCSFTQWWGEKPKAPGIVEMPDRGPSCPDVSLLLEGTDAQSRVALDCLEGQLGSLWTDVYGKTKGVLADEEVETLIKKKILGIPGDPEKAVKRFFAARRLLGLPTPLTKPSVESWLGLLKKYRPSIRRAYQAYQSNTVQYQDIELVTEAFAAALRQMNWSLDAHELAREISSIFEIHDYDILNAFQAAGYVGVNVVNFVCPAAATRDFWNARELAACMEQVVQEFKVGEAWVNFAFGPLHVPSDRELAAIKYSLNGLAQRIDFWFSQPSLGELEVPRWVDLSQKLGINPPDNLLDSLDRVKLFNKKSSKRAIHPSLMISLFKVVKEWQEMVLAGVSDFSAGMERGDFSEIRKRSPEVDLVLRVKNLRYGQKVAPLDNASFAWTLFYYVLSDRIIKVLDTDGDGRINEDTTNQESDVVGLLSLGLKTYPVVHGFVANIFHKLNGEPFEDARSSPILKTLDPEDLVRVMTMSHEVLVDRDLKERNEIVNLLDKLFYSYGSGSTVLDKKDLTAIMVLIDSFGAFRTSYTKILQDRVSLSLESPDAKDEFGRDIPGADERKPLVPRAFFREKMPELLAEAFPRTFEACKKFGFHRSCAVVFDEVLPNVDVALVDEGVYGPPQPMISINDLDLFTLIAAGGESLFDACDYNNNGKLSMSINWFKGHDELDCGFRQIKTFIGRLMSADVIQGTGTAKATAKSVLWVINSNFITRDWAKLALAQGSTGLFKPLFSPKFSAKLGALYGISAELLNKDRAKAKLPKTEENPEPTSGPSSGSAPAPTPTPVPIWMEQPGEP